MLTARSGSLLDEGVLPMPFSYTKWTNHQLKGNTMSSKNGQLPVLSYSTGAGWSTLGMARNPKAAAAIAMRHLGDSALSLIKNHGFKLQVSQRTDLQRELNGGPEGYIFGVGKTIPRH